MENVSERIKNIMEWLQLSSAEFADQINISRSRLSHILNGRNNPSLEIITEILKNYDSVDPDWLILGKGQMLRESQNQSDELKKNDAAPHDLFSIPKEDTIKEKVETREVKDEEPITKKKSQKNYDEMPEIKSVITSEPAAVQSVMILFKNKKYLLLYPEKLQE